MAVEFIPAVLRLAATAGATVQNNHREVTLSRHLSPQFSTVPHHYCIERADLPEDGVQVGHSQLARPAWLQSRI